MVAATTLYGGTYTQFDVSFRKMGYNVTFVDPDNPENFRKAIAQDQVPVWRNHLQSARRRAGY
jgi:O-acetylhomoserine (thiol)-lyase